MWLIAELFKHTTIEEWILHFSSPFLHFEMTRIKDHTVAWLLTLCLFAARWLLYLFPTAIILVSALKNWLPVFHLQWLGHVPHGRHHLPTTIVWNSPVQKLIGSEMVSSFLLPAFGTLSLLLYFQLPSIFLPSKGRSITTLGTRWHDFFVTLFRYFMFLFYSFHCLSPPIPKGCRLEKGHIVPIQCSHS